MTSNQTVSLHLRAGAAIPREIVLPMKLVAALNIPRRFLIHDPEQEVPLALKHWMQRTAQYKEWFASEDAAIPDATDTEKRLITDDLVEPIDEGAHVTLPPPEAVVEDPHMPPVPEADAAPVAVNGEPMVEEAEAGDEPLPYPNEAWSPRWNVPDLRAYAKDAEVKVLSSDLKDDIIAKLRAANKPEQGA